MSEVVKFPFGDADVQVPSFSATPNFEIKNTNTVIKIAAPSAAITALSLTASKDLMPGSKVKVDVTQNGTGRNVTFGSAGSGIVAPALTGVANDRDVIELTWDGSAFVANTVWQKIVDAA